MIILMGVAGAGKSMQGRIFADEHGYSWISTGELFRVLVTGERRQKMLQGHLLSDSEVIELVDKTFNLIDLKEEFLLDGFPRTVPQTKWLLEQIHKKRLNLTAVFNLEASLDIVEKRLINRGRLDDTPESIKRRFEEYKNTTLPILELFKNEDCSIYNINANNDPLLVHDEIRQYIGL